MKKIILTTMMVAFLGFCSSAFADELQDLRTQLQNQYKIMQEMQAKLIELESKQKVQDEQIKTIGTVNTVNKEAFKVPETLKWAEKIKLYGDFRFRGEWFQADNNQVKQNERTRGRIRFRIGMDVKAADELDVRARLASGSSDDPTSTNQTLGENWVKKDFWLDRAYMDWHPKAVEGLHVLAGKMGMPFRVINDLIWDADVNPEGAAVTYSWKPQENLEAFLAGGGFWVQENASDADIGMWGIQSASKYTIDKDQYLHGGVTYYDYTNIENQTVITYGSTNARGGNTVYGPVSPYKYRYDYNLLELFGEYGYNLFDMPSAIQAQYVNNLASGVSADTGWLVGLRLNNAKKAGTWQFNYDYREAQRDSVLGAFAETDFIDGGVGGRGHRLGYKYQFTNNIFGQISYFMSERARSNSSTSGAGSNKADDDYQKIRAEMVISF